MTVIPTKFAKTTGIALFAAALLSAAPVRAEAAEVGFSELRIANGDQKPLLVGIWYPTAAPAEVHPLGAYVQAVALDAPVAGEHLPLIVMSHGNGGTYQNDYDTALALAKAGFVAIAVSHTGDTYDDQSRALFFSDRLQHIRRVHQRGYKKSRLLRRGIILSECFLDMGENQFDRPNRPAIDPSADRLLKARHFPF